MLAGALAAAARPALARRRVVVFAAASLKPPLDAIAARWDGPVALSYGGSGTLARQVAAGAPAQVVILAAQDWMDWLASQGAVAGPVRSVAGNRLVLVGPPGAAPVALEAGAMLDRLEGGRLAIGDPVSVPAGRYARAAFETLGLWDALAPRLLAASDARAALAYVEGGDAALGAAYASDAAGARVAVVADLPPGSHPPIAYPAALAPGAGPDAAAFLDRVLSAADVFAAHGFAP